uniref:Uncharacterized protein n=1 Tax=Pan troglodytes TaxID=9598 RepID=A0A2I3SNN1_PANTR
MNQSRSRSDGGGEETLSQDRNHCENGRRWQQEHLHREEDHNLLGSPREITSEELQQWLDGVNKQLASQPDSRNGTNWPDTVTHLNTFRGTGNATQSGQNGNQNWRATYVKNNSRRRIQQILNCCTTTSNNHTGPSSEKDPSRRK